MPANVGFRDLIRAKAEGLLPADLLAFVAGVVDDHATLAPMADWLTENKELELGRAAHWMLKAGVEVIQRVGDLKFSCKKAPEFMVGHWSDTTKLLGEWSRYTDTRDPDACCFDTFLQLMLAVSDRLEFLRKAVGIE